MRREATLYLSRYTLSKPSVIVELDPATGEVLREFPQPEGWQWDPERPHAHWEDDGGRRLYVYCHADRLVFQAGSERHVLGPGDSARIDRVRLLWKRFSLYRDGQRVFRFTYRDPQTRTASLLAALAFDDDWWDWDTPFDSVEKLLREGRG